MMLGKISRRWGQWASFTYGVLAMTWGLTEHLIVGVAAGAALLATGVALRAINLWREASQA